MILGTLCNVRSIGAWGTRMSRSVGRRGPWHSACLCCFYWAVADAALAAWQALPQGRSAAIIGSLEEEGLQRVVLETALGGERFLEELEDDPLPRIC